MLIIQFFLIFFKISDEHQPLTPLTTGQIDIPSFDYYLFILIFNKVINSIIICHGHLPLLSFKVQQISTDMTSMTQQHESHSKLQFT